MSVDLAILVPSRGRPANVERLAEACAKTCRTNYDLHFGFDEDDPARPPSISAAKKASARYTVAPRMGLTTWTNQLAKVWWDTAPYLASLGDDMVPETDGWDAELITSVEHTGGGFAYPNDLRTDEIPEAVVVSSSIPRALGWFACPAMEHWYIDNVWRDLGSLARCLTYREDVIVVHRHPNLFNEPGDRTYWDAAKSFNPDLAKYQRWRLRDMPGCVRTVRGVLEAQRNPV